MNTSRENSLEEKDNDSPMKKLAAFMIPQENDKHELKQVKIELQLAKD